MDARKTYSLHRSLGYQLTLTAALQERRIEDGLRTLGLTRIFWAILVSVGYETLHQPSAIAEYVGIDRTATSRALRQMEQAGLIERAGGKVDRRTTEVRLTALGKQRLAEATPMAETNARIMDSRLAPGERDILETLLAKLRSGDHTPLARL